MRKHTNMDDLYEAVRRDYVEAREAYRNSTRSNRSATLSRYTSKRTEWLKTHQIWMQSLGESNG